MPGDAERAGKTGPGAHVHRLRCYLEARRALNEADDDFVEEALADPALPDAQSWDVLEAYLTRRGVRGEALRSARDVYRRYTEVVRALTPRGRA